MKAARGTLADVVSLRIYIVQEKMSENHHIADTLKTFFPKDRAPATTWVGVQSLANKEFLIEIEAMAVIE